MTHSAIVQAVVDHASAAFDVDSLRVSVQSLCSAYGNYKREYFALLRMPSDCDSGALVMVYLHFVMIGGRWVQTKALTGPVK